MAAAETSYLEVGIGGADERLEQIVYGRFLELEPRKAFFEAYKDLETPMRRSMQTNSVDFARASIALCSRSPKTIDHVSWTSWWPPC